MTGKKKIKAYYFGKVSEYIAVVFLFFKGYQILETRYKTKVGEIDIIAYKKGYYVFTEVKARQDRTAALNAISQHQKNRISRAAETFMQRKIKTKDLNRSNFRFDVIVITPLKWPVHIKDAW